MSARVVTRKISTGQTKALHDIINTLNGDDDVSNLENLHAICKIRSAMYQAGMTLVVKLIELARALSSDALGEAVAAIRTAHGEMFANTDFRIERDVLSDERKRQLKADHVATRKHTFLTKALAATAALATAGFGKEIPDFDERFITLPFEFLGVEVVGLARRSGKLGELPQLLRNVYIEGHKLYEASLMPEVDADSLFASLTTALSFLVKDSRGCKKAMGLVGKAQDLFKQNMGTYLREARVQNNPMAMVELLIADVQEQAADSKISFTEFAILTRKIRTLSNKTGGKGAAPVAKVLDVIDGLVDSLSNSDERDTAELLAESERARTALLAALSDF